LLWRVEADDDARGLDELAGLVQLSRFHFRASFQPATGMTPHEWLTTLRMRCACELPERADWPVITIAGVKLGTPRHRLSQLVSGARWVQARAPIDRRHVTPT
jgi:methylphosphotriester-DNA--protein-cysteine methyltransferase